MAVEAGPLNSRHERDLAAFKRSVRRGTIRPLLLLIGVLLVVFWMFSSRATREEIAGFEQSRSDLAARGGTWTLRLLQTQEDERQWLARRGMGSERRLYDAIGAIVFKSALAVSGRYEEGGVGGVCSRAAVALHAPILRVSFLIVACWRIWLAAVIMALLWGMLSVRAYRGDDILGQTGNGRLFFSGIYSKLGHLTERGEPDLQVTGLACPASVSAVEAKASPLTALLEKYHAVNETNLALIGIIRKHAEMPAYAPSLGEGDLPEGCLVEASLEENAALILEKALSLDLHYRAKTGGGGAVPLLEEGRWRGVQDSQLLPVIRGGTERIDKHQYAEWLQQSMHRVLTPEMRAELIKIDPKELAAAVLAFEAGKVLAFAQDRGRWIRKSNFPQLCARAVLHSIPSYARNFNFQSRELIRRGLIYGLRGSVFGPVRFPQDLSPQARALRQWIELLIAAPHALDAVTDEVELVGLITQSYTSWRERFFEGIMIREGEALDGAVAVGLNLLFVPAQTIIKMMHRVVDVDRRARLNQLIAQVSQRQKQRMIEARVASGDEEVVGVPDYERIYSPLETEEIKALAGRHSLAVEQVRDWMAYRVVLNAYGWLGKRVGDSTVSEDCLTVAVFEVGEEVSGRNSLGLLGRVGMVAMRATGLQERLGPQWSERFVQASSAAIAHTREDYERLLKGMRESDRDDPGEFNPAV